MAFNPVQNFQQGYQVGNEIQVNQLQKQLGQESTQQGFDPLTSASYNQLAALDPSKAQGVLDTFQALDSRRQKAFFEDASEGAKLLERGDIDGFYGLASDRLANIEKLGGDTSDTKLVLDMVNAGDIQGAYSQLKQAEQAGIDGGYLKNPVDKKSTKQRDWDSMTEGLTPVQKRQARLIKLGLSPRAVGSSAQTISQDKQLTQDVADSEAAIIGAKEASKLAAEFKLKPQIAKAVAIATAEVAREVKMEEEGRSNARALRVYNAAFKSLGEALGKTTTGPIAGLFPALTSDAQSAKGAVAIVLPTLKAIFRLSGEGVFTDRDQQLLTDMAPTRKDSPETIAFKLKAIDAVVMEKLGQSQQGAPANTQQLSDEEILKQYGGL